MHTFLVQGANSGHLEAFCFCICFLVSGVWCPSLAGAMVPHVRLRSGVSCELCGGQAGTVEKSWPTV